MASPAQATEHNGVVEAGELGLYYTQGSGGLVFDMYNDDLNLSGNVFPGTTISANNNTESYRNRDSNSWDVYTGASWTGAHGCLPQGWVGNASTTFKNNIDSAHDSVWVVC